MAGQLVAGNIDLKRRPRVTNADGSISTVRSIGVNVDGKEVLLPTVSDDGRIMSDNEAVETYRKTGRHLGVFDSPEASTAYAEKLHEDQEAMVTSAPSTLAQMVRSKHPGQYDDLSDLELEQKIDAKFPGAYDDVARTRNRGEKPDTPSMQAGAGQDQRSAAGHLLKDAGAAVAGAAGTVGQMVKGAAGMVGYGARAAAAPITVPLGVDTVGALVEQNPGINMAKAYAADIGDRATRAATAAKMGDTQEAVYQGGQAVLSTVPGYGPVSRAGERAVGKADGQDDLIEADPAAAGELAAQAAMATVPARAVTAPAGAVARGVANLARSGSRFLARSAIKPLVSSMKKVAGASATGVEAQASAMVDFIVENRIATPEQAAKIVQQTGQEVDRLLSLKNAPTDAATRSQRYLEVLRSRAAKAGLAEDQVAIFESKMKELVRGPMGEEAVRTVSKPGAVLDSAGKPVMAQVEETVRQLRDEVPAAEALESARASSRNQTRRAWGEQKGAEMEATKAVERAQRDAVKAAVPEVAPLLRRQGKAIQAQEALDRMSFREANREPMGLAGQLTVAGGAAAGGGAGAGVTAMAMEVLRSGKLRGSFALDTLAKALEGAVSTGNVRQQAFLLQRIGVTVAPRDLKPVPAPASARLPRAAEDDKPRRERVASR